MTDDMQAAFRDVAEIFQFEHWLRFYFSKDRGGKMAIEMPPEAAAQARQSHPQLAGLIDTLNNSEIDYESSVRRVGEYVHKSLDGPKYGQRVVPTILDSKDFKVDLHLFSLWVRGHEALLDEKILDFGEWASLFAAWKATDQVKRYAESLRRADKVEHEASGAVH
ncbi:MAG: hypothetical protein HQK81_13520 [Desulfovibrionaceae bacterium]|nr:hypothetical protein [Desulfovibrionaceae bacterium]MBF0515062.1 hypothetical protein [Desulfovibrionaceae bacterium]